MIDYRSLKNWEIPSVEQAYDEDTTALYALGIGLGADPLDEKQLRFVADTVDEAPFALPTMATVLGYPGPWMMYRASETVLFRARAIERDKVVLDRGYALIADA